MLSSYLLAFRVSSSQCWLESNFSSTCTPNPSPQGYSQSIHLPVCKYEEGITCRAKSFLIKLKSRVSKYWRTGDGNLISYSLGEQKTLMNVWEGLISGLCYKHAQHPGQHEEPPFLLTHSDSASDWSIFQGASKGSAAGPNALWHLHCLGPRIRLAVIGA